MLEEDIPVEGVPLQQPACVCNAPCECKCICGILWPYKCNTNPFVFIDGHRYISAPLLVWQPDTVIIKSIIPVDCTEYAQYVGDDFTGRISVVNIILIYNENPPDEMLLPKVGNCSDATDQPSDMPWYSLSEWDTEIFNAPNPNHFNVHENPDDGNGGVDDDVFVVEEAL